ncbi:cytochrome P450 [Hypoxylon crocopeplum]|nr:cytochrome P450 [Hypoxylon crocopeplum]
MELTELLKIYNATVLVNCLLGSWVLYQFLTALYNISSFHPLSHIPGPKLARATYLLEFYYDLIKYGRYTKRIKRMHDEYGPIVRINPNEVHCNDVNFMDEIYTTPARKRDKSEHITNGTSMAESEFATPDHDLHRRRRSPVIKFFSRGMITKLEGDIHGLTHTLCDKLASSTNEPIDLFVAYSCFSSDAISAYCFGDSFGFLDRKGWFSDFHTAELAILKPMFVFRFFPVLRQLARLGDYFVDYLPADISLLIRTLKIDIPNKIRNTRDEIDSGIIRDRPTIFSSLLQMDPRQREQLHLGDEAATLLGAGTETTSWTLAVITYHLLNQPELLARLSQELHQAVDDPQHLPSWNVLERVPYLQAVIKEGLRLSYGTSARSSRVPTQESLLYRGEWEGKQVEYVIPRGYAIGVSSAIIHHDESVFPNSSSFMPERWLDAEKRKLADRGMFAFSRGSRSCIGMNLALCEIYVGLAALTLRVLPRMRLFETTEEDVLYDYDMLIPMPNPASKGVRVTISPI